MPSAGKSVVELVSVDGVHEAWVEIPGYSERGLWKSPLASPVILHWGADLYIWADVSAEGYYVFRRASSVYSGTLAPGLPDP